MTNDQNEELEVKIAFLEDALAHLSDEFFTQQKELDILKNQVALLVEKVRNSQNSEHGSAEITDEKPPHY